MSEDNDIEDRIEDSAFEAYSAHERVKSDILNAQAAVNLSMFNYIRSSCNRSKKNKNRTSDDTAQKHWLDFQSSILILYKILKPHLKYVNKNKEYENIDKKLKVLDKCFVNLIENGKYLKATDWREFSTYFDYVIQDIGVSKIELDKQRENKYHDILAGT